MIKEVILDIDNTLYDYEKGHAHGTALMVEYAKRELGIGGEEFLESYHSHYKKIIGRLGQDDAAIHSRSIRLLEMLEDWGKPIFPHLDNLYNLYWDGLLEVSTPEPGSLETVSMLKDRGIAIGIGTDMTLRMQLRKLETLGFSPYVDHIVTSQEAGVEKPQSRFMELCIEKSGCRPQECAFVGDSFKKDACGSAKAGMLGIWYNRKNEEYPSDVIPVRGKLHEIRSFSELVPYIDSINNA